MSRNWGAPAAASAVARHHYRLLSGLQACLQSLIALLAQQAAADRRRGDERDVEIDEGIARIARFRVLRGGNVAGLGKRLVDVADGQMQPPHRAVTQEACCTAVNT